MRSDVETEVSSVYVKKQTQNIRNTLVFAEKFDSNTLIMPMLSLESLGLDVSRLGDPNSFDNCLKGFALTLEDNTVRNPSVHTDLTMNEATSHLSSVKSESANLAQCQEYNPFLSNDKVSESLALLMSSQIGQGCEMEAVLAQEGSLCPVSSPMSTTCSSEPASPFSMDNSMVSSPMIEGPNHPTFDEDTISSLASLLEDDVNNNDRGFWEEEPKVKVQRTSLAHSSPGSAGQVPQSPMEGFDFGLAVSDPSFMSTNFNLEGVSTEKGISPVPVPTSIKRVCPRKASKSKPPSLNLTFPNNDGGATLSILVQPEKHHRARYLTEGSRGSVKDETQQGFPTLKLNGASEGATLHVFVASDQGKVKPHGYYQACKVTGRNTTPCKEIDIDGTTVIEIPWESTGKMEMSIDCVGILKLRNADVEQRIGLARSKRKSTTVRLVFRVFITRPNGTVLTLQHISSPICCTQPLGHPEIVKKSLMSCSVQGEEDLFIIGKNFIAKHTKVKLQELCPLGKVLWEGNCEIDRALFHNTHIVCRIPPYKSLDIERPKEVYLVVTSGANKTSELYAHPINYMPSSEKETNPECVILQSGLGNINVTSHVEAGETSPASLCIPFPQLANNLRQIQTQSSRLDARTSFADTLKAAAQIELKSPGLLAKLAHQDPNISNLLDLITETADPAATSVVDQTVFKELIELGIVDVKGTNNADELGLNVDEALGEVLIRDGECTQASCGGDVEGIDNLLYWWKGQDRPNGSVEATTLDDVASVLPL